MKLLLIETPPHILRPTFSLEELLTVGKWYDGGLAPTLNSYQNGQRHQHPSYVVRCNDDHWRIIGTEYFITLEEWREKKLKELGL